MNRLLLAISMLLLSGVSAMADGIFIPQAAYPKPPAIPAQRALVVHRVAQNPEVATSWAIMQGPWKYIHDGDRQELYDIDDDPQERDNVVGENAKIVGGLRKLLSEYRENTKPIGSDKVDLILDPETVEALRKLGYGD